MNTDNVNGVFFPVFPVLYAWDICLIRTTEIDERRAWPNYCLINILLLCIVIDVALAHINLNHRAAYFWFFIRSFLCCFVSFNLEKVCSVFVYSIINIDNAWKTILLCSLVGLEMVFCTPINPHIWIPSIYKASHSLYLNMRYFFHARSLSFFL